MNETMNVIKTRFSCRKFKSTEPKEQDLKAIMEAALCSPSGMNRQKWQIIAVQNQALIKELEDEGMKSLKALPDQSTYERIMSRGGKLFYNAPLIIFIAIEKSTPEVAPAYSLDCGIVAQNIALAAKSFGLDNVICGLAGFCFSKEKEDYFRKKLEMKYDYFFGMSVLIGYADMEGAPHTIDYSKLTYIK
jgi:nitroreductase